MNAGGKHISPHQDRPRLYGRSKGRPLRARQNELMDSLYPQISILDNLDKIDAAVSIFLEIGFGGSEHVVHLARQNPGSLIIGAEPFLNGVARALTAVEADALSNLMLHHGDARDVIDHLPDNSLERVYLLFPDPWPKKRHRKRRIVNQGFLEDIARILKPGGILFFASDISDYVDWTLARIMRHRGFDFSPSAADDWRLAWPDWPGTRYEAKAKKAGRVCHYLKFSKLA